MSGQYHIATPNPEMIVEAQRNMDFKTVLQNTALNLPDGVGLLWAAKKISSTPLPERITGADTMEYLCSPCPRICPPERIFLLGAAPDIAEKTATILKKHNHLLKEIGAFSGSPKQEDETDIIERINSFKPTLLFVAFGAPLQDIWIARNMSKLKTVKVAMGVGGTFDFIVGKQRRAPRWMRKMEVEWLWRLILEPKRIKRIWKAVVVFPYLVLRKY